MKRIAYVGFGFALSLGMMSLPAGAQNNAQSNPQSQPSAGDSPLGDYARQVRKDGAPTKAKPRVFDNDNLPTQDKLSIVGTAREPVPPAIASSEAQPAAAPAATTGDNKAPDTKASGPVAPPKSAQEEEAARQASYKQWQTKIAAQKDQIDLSTRELDVLQREYQIRAAAMYADAGNRMRNSGDWDKKDTEYKQQIADRQKAVEDAKQKLDDLQEEARKAGVPASQRE
jgi:hypothetical protein